MTENLSKESGKKNPDKQVKTSRNPDGTFPKGVSGNLNGRPKKFTIYDYVTDKEVHELVELAKKQAREGKTDMLKYLLEHIFGKPAESVDFTSAGKELNFYSDEQKQKIISEYLAGRTDTPVSA